VLGEAIARHEAGGLKPALENRSAKAIKVSWRIG
jgi:hypothetical protein